jgi:hypothetical protein
MQRRIMMVLVLILVPFFSLSVPFRTYAQQRRIPRVSSGKSSINSARIRQLRQELKNTKDASRRKELRKELMQLQFKNLKNISNLRLPGNKTNPRR